MLIRREVPGDRAAVHDVPRAAFGKDAGPPPVEAVLLEALRECDGWLPALSCVAVVEGEVVGHVVGTRGYVGERPGVGLGPLSVRPEHQRRGVGLALVHTVLGAADALGEPFVALLGSPEYYGRFGFGPAAGHGIEAPDPAWGRYFQVRPLTAHDPAVRGTFRYAEPFDRV
ncbi:GNAT family N-acetyltransferase [Streptomyces specialis]|uniref:GNAT family N-acetyltransferase n=1 Tax=Streptomyces specialis TaxID=498367 RepID=UPI00073F8B33|nr:N-acetyltransferase [Streptomyces specialis]